MQWQGANFASGSGSPTRHKTSVQVLADSWERHVSGLLAGLAEMQALGEIELNYTLHPHRPAREWAPHTLWLEFHQPGASTPTTVCFDMADWPAIASPDGLARCDMYLKRRFVPSALAQLPDHLARKVEPYGFYFPCKDGRNYQLIKRGLLSACAGLLAPAAVSVSSATSASAPPALSLRSRLTKLRHVTSAFSRPRNVITLQDISQSADNPDAAASELPQLPTRVLFQTRVFDPAEFAHHLRAELHALNEFRVATVRALRGAFGDQFYGGVAASHYAQTHWQDCVTPQPTHRSAFLAALRGSAIAVTTVGLSGSTGAKLPEYLAAGKCIVSQTIRDTTPRALLPDVNYAAFDSPASCVARCRQLLADPDARLAMGRRNRDFYLTDVAPEAILRRLFDGPHRTAASNQATAPITRHEVSK